MKGTVLALGAAVAVALLVVGRGPLRRRVNTRVVRVDG
jgi:hypothetical protein